MVTMTIGCVNHVYYACTDVFALLFERIIIMSDYLRGKQADTHDSTGTMTATDNELACDCDYGWLVD